MGDRKHPRPAPRNQVKPVPPPAPPRRANDLYIERLALCPDHRDKATGRCVVCVAEERTRREERDARLDAVRKRVVPWESQS